MIELPSGGCFPNVEKSPKIVVVGDRSRRNVLEVVVDPCGEDPRADLLVGVAKTLPRFTVSAHKGHGSIARGIGRFG